MKAAPSIKTPKQYLAGKHADRLEKVSCGESCVRFKKLEDLNREVALELIKQSVPK